MTSNLLAWSLQVALVAGSAALVARLMPVDSAAVRHAWWRAVLVLCLALPVIQPWQHTAVPLIPAASIDGARAGAASSGTQAPHSAPGAMRFGVPVPPWPALLAIALASGALLRLAWLAAGLVGLRRLRRAGVPVSPDETDVELQTLVQAGAEIRYVDAVGQPVTFGIRRPVVLLPASFRGLPPAVQRAVLAHELWHVRRRDWAWVVAEETLRGVLWFHPAIWWLISRVQSSREEVVDELTVLLTSSRRSYVEALLAFADQPPLFPAAPFARRRNLLDRMLLISKEGVMSSKRIVASCAGMLLVLALTGWYGVAAFPLKAALVSAAANEQAPPRDPRPGDVRPATAREVELSKTILQTPGDPSAFLALAQLQELRGAVTDAEATLLALRQAEPTNVKSYNALAGLYVRTGQFDRGVGVLEDATALDPLNPSGYQVLATHYWEKASHDQNLGPTEKMFYIRQGVAATDRALLAKPDFVDALAFKNLLLRLQAGVETDPVKQRALVAEADTLRERAMALRPANRPDMRFVSNDAAVSVPPPPPPPPPPPRSVGADDSGLRAPIRVGGDMRPPKKIRDVRPVYPEVALAAGVTGVVIIEAVLDETGAVTGARVLRSIPLLDEAAIEAVRQWRFEPTLLNGAAVPVIMTVTVNFAM
jgi:TonB family protein